MLAGFTLEANIRLDYEFNAGGLQSRRQVLPLVPRENHAEVRHWHIVPIDGIGMRSFRSRFRRLVMGNNLMTVQIEVDPGIAATAFGTPQNVAVKLTRRRQIGNAKGEMEGTKCLTCSSVGHRKLPDLLHDHTSPDLPPTGGVCRF